MKKNLFLPLVLIFGILQSFGQNPRNTVRFGMVTDVHYADIPDNGIKTYNQSLVKLKECVDTMNRQKVDFLVELGDLKDMNTPAAPAKALIYLFRAEKALSLFKGPLYHVLGNHDEDCISKKQFLSEARNTGIPANSTWYSFDTKGVHFIVLDACFDSVGHDYDKGKFNWGDPNIPSEELKWLKKDLRKATGATILFTHQPLDGETPYTIKNSRAVRKLLENSGKVAAVFQGHYHEGNYHFINGIHYYTLKALVDGSGPENNSYAIVEITPENIRIKGFRKAVSMQFNNSR